MRVLRKLAQPTTSGTGQQGAQPAIAATPNADSPSITSFGINFGAAWGPKLTPPIAAFIAKIDKAIIAGTAAQNQPENFKSLWDVDFEGKDSAFTSPVSDLIALGKTIHRNFINGKQGFPSTSQLDAATMHQRFDAIAGDPHIAKLSQVNPSGPLGKQNATLSGIQQQLSAIQTLLPPR